MSDKKWLNGLMGGWGNSKPAEPLATSTRRCVKGHPMALDWLKCPYCAAAENAHQRTDWTRPPPGGQPFDASRADPGRTQVNGEPGFDERMAPQGNGNNPGRRRGTQILPEGDDDGYPPEPPPATGVAGGNPRRSSTRVLDSDASGPATAPVRRAGGRRLTGIVVTFSWSSLGQLYEVHEGRNFGGSGTVMAEGDRDADILVEDDATMSATHFLILCQGGKYRISDCNSTNGTIVNGEYVNALGIDLVDNAQIQAGATLMVFKKIQAPAGAPLPSGQPDPDEIVEPEPAPVRRTPPHRPDRDDTLI